jgi:hypothetical protein
MWLIRPTGLPVLFVDETAHDVAQGRREHLHDAQERPDALDAADLVGHAFALIRLNVPVGVLWILKALGDEGDHEVDVLRELEGAKRTHV